MDFGKLLHVAKKNSSEANQARCYSTKFAPPKKESKDKNLSSGIQKFLAKRDAEEREKERQLRENRERLQAMRDNKSKNKISKMLKVIKSANKSVLGAEDSGSDNQQPVEPDEDDYGYVSQEASAQYKRLMEKYKTVGDNDTTTKQSTARPSKPAAVTASRSRPPPATSSQVVATKEARRPNGSSTAVKSTGGPGKAAPITPSPPPKVVKRRPPPPPVANFEALLKLAEKKQFEPIKVDHVDPSLKNERPMTQKEKREHEERMRMAEARKKRLETDNYDYRRPAPEAIPKAKPSTSDRQNPPAASSKITPTAGRPPTATVTKPTTATTPQNKSVPPPPPVKTRQFPPADVQRTRAFPPEDVMRKASAATSRPFPPADVRRKATAGPSPRDFKRPRRDEEEDERDDYGYEDEEEEDDYDSEMDDFIDDGPLGQSDVSQCIKEIFGYDKSRYRDEEFDDREMESSFAQQMREESYSRKVGRLEDEADMRQEALDKARKAALKRAQKR